MDYPSTSRRHFGGFSLVVYNSADKYFDQGLYRQSEAHERAVRNGTPRPRPRRVRRDPQYEALLEALRAISLTDEHDSERSDVVPNLAQRLHDMSLYL